MRFTRKAAILAASRVPLVALFVLAMSVIAARAGELHAGVKAFRFIVYGDTRDGHAMHRKLVSLIMQHDPSMVIQTGDLVHTGSNASLWKIYDDITGDMRKKVPVYPARGNHDIGGKGYEERVTAPYTSGNKLYYSFDRENSHFIALAIDEVSDYSPGSQQYLWLVKDLQAARSKVKTTFVFFHVPPYSIGSHGSDERVREALCPLFIQYGVTAVFNGHDHNYYRTVRDGVTYIVSGGGGAQLYPCNVNKGVIPGDKYQSINHIVVCDVNGDTMTITALRSDDSILDRFTLSAR